MAGDLEFRAVYLHNANSTATMYNVKVWIVSDTPGMDVINIGLGTSAIGGTEQTIANENTAPSGVTFSAPTSFTTGLLIGNIPAGSHKAIWIRRNVPADSTLFANDFYVLQFRGYSDHT